MRCGPQFDDGARGERIIETWVTLTIAAAFLQNVRSMLQKSLKGRLGTTGATFVRFIYALPIALLYVVGLSSVDGFDVPVPGTTFAVYACVGGLAQIAGTALLVSLFDQRSFAVATTFSKTETVQAALFAIAFLGETVTRVAGLGIAVGLIGVVMISTAHTAPSGDASANSLRTRAVVVGLGSGAAFGLAAVAYRGAALSLGGDGFAMQSALTLLCVLAFQTLAMGLYMVIWDRAELAACFATWRVSSLVGLFGALASAGWFGAMTLQNAALVRSVGQIELLFTLGGSILIFGERITRREILGMLAVTAGILILLRG